jgi:hypothetical protein
MARRPAKGARRAAPPAERMLLVRRLHAYIGAFIAPSVLFFAITGGMQLFSLHETHAGYRPPPLIEKLGEVHKKQRFAVKAKRPVGAKAAAGKRTAEKAAEKPKATPVKVLALKWLFLAVAVGLALSTLLGIWLAVAYSRNKRLVWLLLVLGAALPVALAVL